MRKTTLLWLILAVFCGTGIFHTSQKVHDEREKIDALEAGIAKEKESLRVLNAEWSYLNQPARLEKLAKTYLHLAPLKGGQFTKVENIPLRSATTAQTDAVTEENKVAEKKPEEKKTVKPRIAATTPAKNKQTRLIPLSVVKDESANENLVEEVPAHKSSVKAASLEKSPASPHSFADLMKNLRQGTE